MVAEETEMACSKFVKSILVVVVVLGVPLLLPAPAVSIARHFSRRKSMLSSEWEDGKLNVRIRVMMYAFVRGALLLV